MIDKSVFECLTERIDSYKQAMVEMQISLTAIPALSPENGGDGEYEKSRFLLSCLRRLGFPAVGELNAPDPRVSSGVRPNLIVTLSGKDKKKTIWILTHMDIVPPGEIKLWSQPPYKGYVRDEKIFGRGTEDNQQDLVASIFAAKAFLAEGVTPEVNIGLAFVSDEETASQYGLPYLLKNEKNPFLKSDLIVVPDSGDENGTMIEVAEKSLLWLRIKTTGKQCHGSRPSQGNNAFLAASHLVVRLNELHQIFDDADLLYDSPSSTFQPTKKEANVPNINTIPGEDSFYMDCRVLPRYPLKNVLAEIRKIADQIESRFAVAIELTPIHQVQAPPPTPHDAPVVLALQEAISHVYHVQAVPAGVGAGTIAAFFRSDGYPAAVWCRTSQTAHQPDEYSIIANMMGNAKVYAYLFCANKK